MFTQFFTSGTKHLLFKSIYYHFFTNIKIIRKSDYGLVYCSQTHNQLHGLFIEFKSTKHLVSNSYSNKPFKRNLKNPSGQYF